MTAEPDALPARPRRLWLRALLGLAAIPVAAEVGSFLGYWLTEGQAFSHGRVRARQAAIVAEQPGVPAAQGSEEFVLPSRTSILHPYVGYTPAPISGEEHPAAVELMQQRFFDRGAPHFAHDGGTLVVGITGGSVANHMFLDSRTFLEEELRASAAAAGRRVEFVGLAYGGYKQPQQLLLLNYVLALGVELDVLINLDGFNEVALHAATNAKQGVHPSYPRAWYQRVSSDASLVPLIGEITYLDRLRTRTARDAMGSPLRASVSFNTWWSVRDRRLQSRLATLRAALDGHRPEDAEFEATGPATELQGEGELYAELVAIWRRSSLQMHQLCESRGILYVHFLQPNQYVPDSKVLSDHERRHAIRENHPYRPGALAGYPGLIGAGPSLSAAGVRFHDLTGLFRDVDATVYADACCHFNDLGKELLARAVGAAVADALR